MNDTVETSTARPVPASFDNKVDFKDASFFFKKVKDEASGVETKRPTIELKLPVPSVEGINAILEAGGKDLELLMEACQVVVSDRARDIINSDEKITSENFPYGELAWSIIAALPKEDRRSAIPKEVWEDFSADYATVMPSIGAGTKDQALTAAKIFTAKFAQVKARKDIIEKLLARLDLYTENSPKAGEYANVIEALQKRGKTLIEAKEENLADNLGL